MAIVPKEVIIGFGIFTALVVFICLLAICYALNDPAFDVPGGQRR